MKADVSGLRVNTSFQEPLIGDEERGYVSRRAPNSQAARPGRHIYFTYKFLKDAELRSRLVGAGSWAVRGRAARQGCSEGLSRCCKSLFVLVVVLGSFFRALAACGMAATEAATMVTLYVLLDPNALLLRARGLRYSFCSSLEDVVAFSLARCVSVLLAYGFGAGRKYQRPYLYTAIVFAVIGLPFVAAKLTLLERQRVWPPEAALLLAASATFSVVHVLTARGMVLWARQRYEMGLLGFGYPWERGEAAWLLLGTPWGAAPQGIKEEEDAAAEDEDLPAGALADSESRFLDLGGLAVHYKEALPPGGGAAAGRAVVLIHGFGGGTFSWRLVMAQLAARAGCRVVALDRPGFGLTARPPVSRRRANLYTPRAAAEATLRLCAALRLRRVVLAGHADGATVALLAAALASRGPASPSWRFQSGSALTEAEGHRAGDWGDRAGKQASSSLAGVPAGAEGEEGRSGQASPMSVSPGSTVWPSEARSRPSTSHSTPMRASRSLQGPLAAAAAAAEEGTYPHWRLASHALADEPAAAAAEEEAPLAASGGGAGRDSGIAGNPSGAGASLAAGTEATEWFDPATPPQSPTARDGGEARSGGADAAAGDAAGDLRDMPEVGGLALLHPTTGQDCEGGLSFTRLLGASRLGRRILRPLLRTELGEVSNRRAWAEPGRLTPDIVALYSAPLRVQGWDAALLEVSRAKRPGAAEVAACFQEVERLPSLVLTGAKDRVVTPQRAAALCGRLQDSRFRVLPGCGHLSHEEAPAALLELLAGFAVEAMGPAAEEPRTE
ncbi:hypothetical protein WJX81_000861 [Elliptochloris bilobata]|uniref:AB hydrolase-1 domain-containing protein n=1 Tax=Elliptochloris bilobata TaxID=381761 RepID=A0AAW1RDN1_9CHLO